MHTDLMHEYHAFLIVRCNGNIHNTYACRSRVSITGKCAGSVPQYNVNQTRGMVRMSDLIT